MTNGGRNLSHWKDKINSKDNKMLFAKTMIYQVLKGLEKIHNFGYSHSDLKMDNICARISSEGQLKFTLIDFGVATRLCKIGETIDQDAKLFRGNMLTSSVDHIISHRASIVDDIYSLICVAH